MKVVEGLFETLENLLWGNWMLFMLLGLGVFYTLITGGIQIRSLPQLVRAFWEKERGHEEAGLREAKGISSMQALCTAVASCVGSGNIVGVATAMIAGARGRYSGCGLRHFSGWRRSPHCCCSSRMRGNLDPVQYHRIGGGLKRLAFVAQRIVPFMAGLYILGGVVVVLSNLEGLLPMLKLVIQSAFSWQAGLGAAAGITVKEAMRYRVAFPNVAALLILSPQVKQQTMEFFQIIEEEK